MRILVEQHPYSSDLLQDDLWSSGGGYSEDPENRTVTPEEIAKLSTTPSKKITPGTETRLNEGVGIIRDELGEYPVIHTYEGEWCHVLFDL